MIGKMVSLGFDLATLPARMTYRGTRAMLAMPGDIERIVAEVQALLHSIDREMSEQTAHLNAEQKQQAAELALDAAERHLSMAAVNLLRALWLAVDSSRRLEQEGSGVVIEHDGPAR
jgi:hypothetical protein